MRSPQSVAIVGGGLAGLAAGCALAEAGMRVTLFERRPYVGGRASSYEHPGTGEVVDNCQHVLLGCCTNLLDFYCRLDVQDRIAWFDELTFIEPGGRRSVIRPAALPAPFHSTLSFLRAGSLTLRDKLGIARALTALIPGIPADSGQNFEQWLKDHSQTPNALERFWKPVLVSALNEELHRVSVFYAAQVFRESFLKSAAAGRMGVPRVPLTELYNAAIAYIEQRGGAVRLRATVDTVVPHEGKVLVTAMNLPEPYDACLVAVPFEAVMRLLRSNESRELADKLARFEHSPITGIHLWFDREITDLPHAVLLDRTIQWMFHKSQLLGRASGGSYVELVVSASKSLVEAGKQEIVDLALKELAEFFPAVRNAQLVKSTVIKEVRATFSIAPGVDAYRPGPVTSLPGVFLAGDWTATCWPATMEGAVRSGYLAAEAITGRKFLVPDLPARGFMRLLA